MMDTISRGSSGHSLSTALTIARLCLSPHLGHAPLLHGCRRVHASRRSARRSRLSRSPVLACRRFVISCSQAVPVPEPETFESDPAGRCRRPASPSAFDLECFVVRDDLILSLRVILVARSYYYILTVLTSQFVTIICN